MGDWNHVELDGSTMRYFTTKPREPNGAGVLVCMHGPGLDEFILDICERLASAEVKVQEVLEQAGDLRLTDLDG